MENLRTGARASGKELMCEPDSVIDENSKDFEKHLQPKRNDKQNNQNINFDSPRVQSPEP